MKNKIANLSLNRESIKEFQNFIHSNKADKIPTGFNQLDNYLHGGLEAGLYIIAAEPGTGKTSYTLQMAEQIASQGTPVFFFSLEMFRYELQAKGIARQSFLMDDGKPFTAGDMFTMKEEQYEAALNRYMEATQDHLYITENVDEGLTDEDIYTTIGEYMKDLDKTPVIIIDYLQLIGNTGTGCNDRKTKTDNILKTLKRIVREYRTPVICISSVNRATYSGDGNRSVTMGSLKESGDIEYNANVIIGLNTSNRKGSKAKCRTLSCDILKNKMGVANESINLHFYAEYGQFEEAAKTVHEKSLKG